MTPVTVASSSVVAAGSGITGWSARSLMAPTYSIGVLYYETSSSNMGNQASLAARAQTVIPIVTGQLLSFSPELRLTGSPADNLYSEICSDSSGTPGSVLATSDNVSGSSLLTTSTFPVFTFSSPATLTAGVKYWATVRRSGAVDASNYYAWVNGGNSNSTLGSSTYNSGTATWSAEATTDYNYVATFGTAQRGYYIVAQDTSGSPKQHVYESNDDGATWTERDSANAPTVTSGSYPFGASYRIPNSTVENPFPRASAILTARFTGTNTLRLREFLQHTNLWAAADVRAADATTTADNLSPVRVAPNQRQPFTLFTSSSDDADILRIYDAGNLSSGSFLSISSAERSIVADAIMGNGFVYAFMYDTTNDDFSVNTIVGTSSTAGTLTDVDAAAAATEASHAPATFEPYHVSGVPRVTAAYIDADDTINERTATLNVTAASISFGTQRQVTTSTAYAGGKLSTCAYDGDRYTFASKADGTSIDYWISTDDTTSNTWGSVNNVTTGTGLHLAQALPVAGVGILIVYNDGSDVVVDWAVDGPAGGVSYDLSGTIAGTSTVTGAAELTEKIAGAIAGTSAVAGTVKESATLAGTVAGTSAVTGDASKTVALSGTIAGTSTVTGSAMVAEDLAGAIAGTSAVTGAITETATLTGTIAGTSTVAGDAKRSLSLAGTSAGTSTVAGAIKEAIKAAGAIAGISVVSGAMDAAEKLAGTVAGTSTVSGSALLAIDAAGTVAGTSTVSGSVKELATLAGAIAGTSTVTGDATTAASEGLSGTVTGTSTVTGNAKLAIDLAGVVAGTSVVSGDAVESATLAGSITGTSTVTGDATIEAGVELSLSGSIAGTSAVTGDTALFVTAQGVLTGSSAIVGAATVAMTLTAASDGTSAVTGSLSLRRGLSGAIAGTSAVAGNAKTIASLSGSIAGTSNVIGDTLLAAWLAGTLAGTSTATGDLVGAQAAPTIFGPPLTATLSSQTVLSATLTSMGVLSADLSSRSVLTATLRGEPVLTATPDSEPVLTARLRANQ